MGYDDQPEKLQAAIQTIYERAHQSIADVDGVEVVAVQLLPALKPHATQAATQVTQAAAPRNPGCNPMSPRLQPHVIQAATPCDPGAALPRARRHGHRRLRAEGGAERAG